MGLLGFLRVRAVRRQQRELLDAVDLFSVAYSGSPGISLENPVVITGAEYDLMGSMAILAWLIRKRGTMGLDWRTLQKSGDFDGQRHIDIYKIQSRSGVTETFYFDVTESWGKFALWNFGQFMFPVANPQRLREYYGALGDEGLREALSQGPFAYHPYAWCVLSREAMRRGVEVPEPHYAPVAFDPTLVADQPIPEDVTIDQLDAALRSAEKVAGVSFLILLGGVIMAIATFASAGEGGNYFLHFGAIVYGLLGMMRGESRIKALKRARAAKTEAEDAEGSGVDGG